VILFRVFLLVLLHAYFASAVCPAADRTGQAVTDASAPAGITFGSRIILSTLWTPEELMGKPEDKQVVRQKNPDPPQRLIPESIHAPLSPEFQNSIRHVQPVGGQKAVALTFDLCESANEKSGYDADIVNYLRENHIKATFFAGGKWMRSHPEKTMQLIADPLFELGNHSWSHANFRMIDAGRAEAQILRTQAQYELLRERLRERVIAKQMDPSEMNRIPATPLLFRFPYGACDSRALDILRQQGLPAIQWDVVTGDPSRDSTPQMIANVVLHQTRPGSIIVCHANGRGYGTARSLPLFVPQLRARGYEFVTVSELLTYGPAVSFRDCYERVPGDNQHDDGKTGKPGGAP
jgi:peptidoglycan/xylan/chitin deacetylase (PgdA/CDA1 family)